MRLSLLSAFALAVFAPAALGAPQTQQAATFRTESSAEFAAHKNPPVLVDVRQPAEWAETGIPGNATGVTLQRPDFVAAVLAEVGGDKTKPVAVICKSGTRSLKAAQQLSDAGFTNVTNIGDGMIGREGVGEGWLAAKLPTRAYALAN